MDFSLFIEYNNCGGGTDVPCSPCSVESKRGERTRLSASRRTSPPEAPPCPAASRHPSHPAIASMTILPLRRPHVPCRAPSFVPISYPLYGHTCAHSYQYPASCFSNLTTTITTCLHSQVTVQAIGREDNAASENGRMVPLKHSTARDVT
jgi:hypothetical protein